MKIANTKDKMNKRLIDSFSVAFVRDQRAERQDYSIMAKNDLKMPNFCNGLFLKITATHQYKK
jgi:hypothetical protein